MPVEVISSYVAENENYLNMSTTWIWSQNAVLNKKTQPLLAKGTPRNSICRHQLTQHMTNALKRHYRAESSLTSPRCLQGGWLVFQSDLYDDSPLCCCYRCSWVDTPPLEEHRSSILSVLVLGTAICQYEVAKSESIEHRLTGLHF